MAMKKMIWMLQPINLYWKDYNGTRYKHWRKLFVNHWTHYWVLNMCLKKVKFWKQCFISSWLDWGNQRSQW